MKNTYRGEPEHKENFSIDEFGLQVKRKALVFTSAGIACLIMTFSAYVIGMEETYPTASKLEQPLISKKKSNISEHAVNESRQLASADVDRPATTENNGETANTSIQPDTNPNDPAPSASNPSPKTIRRHRNQKIMTCRILWPLPIRLEKRRFMKRMIRYHPTIKNRSFRHPSLNGINRVSLTT